MSIALLSTVFLGELVVMRLLALVRVYLPPIIYDVSDAVILLVLIAPFFYALFSELRQRQLAQENAEAKLHYQAYNDELTDLPNRRLLADRLSQALAAARREERMVGLLYMDLDGFKLINDSLGHSIGDLLLSQVATRLRSRVRSADTLARIGGDEFTVVLGHLHSKPEAALVAQQLLEVLAPPFLIEKHEITIGGSIGISIFPEDATDAAGLLQYADCAMYAAKREGRSRVMQYKAELGCSARERMNLENELRGAIDRGEISVHYQPELDLSENHVVRFEALARWHHPTIGDIGPDKFIPIAEESGMIVTLGAYIMEQACREALKWQTITPRPIQVAVNVSSIQFVREHFVDEVMEVLGRTGLAPHLLQIELTESVMLGGVNRSAETMKRLRALGISLAIDDFGTGYSCLSYLPALPFDALKIDRSFVRQLALPKNKSMVQSLIALAHNFGMRVIVEGVESPEQMQLVRELGGNEVQGYLIGRPTADPVAKLSALLDEEDTDLCQAKEYLDYCNMS
jgi:diguanylate cyclase (GGDEF)-like protein